MQKYGVTEELSKWASQLYSLWTPEQRQAIFTLCAYRHADWQCYVMKTMGRCKSDKGTEK